MVLGLSMAGVAHATLIEYQGEIFSGQTVTGTVEGDYGWETSNVTGRDWWYFYGEAGDVVNIFATPTVIDPPGLDPYIYLFSGITTASEEEAFTDPGQTEVPGLTFLSYDDAWVGDDQQGWLWDGMAQLTDFLLPTTGFYTISFFSAWSWDPGPFDYTLIVEGNSPQAAVPEPGTVFLMSAGLIGLIGFRRKLKK